MKFSLRQVGRAATENLPKSVLALRAVGSGPGLSPKRLKKALREFSAAGSILDFAGVDDCLFEVIFGSECFNVPFGRPDGTLDKTLVDRS
jgi:hypothetical protein